MSAIPSSPTPSTTSVAELRTEFETLLNRVGCVRSELVDVDVDEVDGELRVTLVEDGIVDDNYSPGARPIEGWISTVLEISFILERAPTRLVPGHDGQKATVHVPAEPNLEDFSTETEGL